MLPEAEASRGGRMLAVLRPDWPLSFHSDDGGKQLETRIFDNETNRNNFDSEKEKSISFGGDGIRSI
jgi:hypothetical protein